MIRHALAAVGIVVVEVLLYLQYASLGTQFHFWLHLLLGGWLGVGALAAREALRGRGAVRPVEAGFLGHAWSAVPDVLFLVAGVVHVLWMDVFALHITAHFLWPDALVVGSVLWVLSVGALVAVRTGRRRAGTGLLVASALVLVPALALRTPLPASLEQVRELQRDASLITALQGSPWLCEVPLGPVAG